MIFLQVSELTGADAEMNNTKKKQVPITDHK